MMHVQNTLLDIDYNKRIGIIYTRDLEIGSWEDSTDVQFGINATSHYDTSAF